MRSEKNIALLVNPTKENDKAVRVANHLTILLTKKEIAHKVFATEWPSSLNGFTEVWVSGGDGTLNWFVNQYPDADLPIATFPGGSGNDFHWILYGEGSVDDHFERVLHAQPRKVDAGICNGRLFVNGVGIGFDGAIVKDLLGKRKMAGKASYLLSILKHIVGYTEKFCSIQMAGESISQPCFMISVANGRRFGGGFLVTPLASTTDARLDLNIVGRIPPLKRIKYLPVIERGEHLTLPFVQYRQDVHVQIASPEKLHAHIDGEYLYAGNFDISILPGRFSFLC